MKIVFLVLAVFLSQISFAVPTNNEGKKIDLSMELVLDGKKVATPKGIVTEGDVETFVEETPEGKFFITVATMNALTPKEMKNPENKKVIKFQFAVGKFEKDGKEKILTRPQLTIIDGKTGSIEVGKDPAKPEMILSVTAKYL